MCFGINSILHQIDRRRIIQQPYRLCNTIRGNFWIPTRPANSHQPIGRSPIRNQTDHRHACKTYPINQRKESVTMKITYKKLTDLTPYAHNPRINDAAVEAVANSIREFGFLVPFRPFLLPKIECKAISPFFESIYLRKYSICPLFSRVYSMFFYLSRGF